jgi:alpha-amylase
VDLRRHGNVSGTPVTIHKRITAAGGKLSARYRVEAERRLELHFGSEVALTLLAGHDPARQYRLLPGTEGELGAAHLASVGELARAPGIELTDEWLKLSVKVLASPAARIVRYPLETASQSEGGFERTYQGSIVAAIWRAAAGPGEPFEATLTLDTSDL